MNKLWQQVNHTMLALNMFRTAYDLDREYVHCYCLAIAFYLDHYEEKDGMVKGLDHYEPTLKASHLFAYTQ